MLPTNAEQLEAAAREKMSPVAYAFYSSGSFAETSVAESVAAWSRWYVRPRIGRNVQGISTATTVLGTPISMPVMLAPCGFNKLAHPDGEIAVARACADAGTIQVLSSASGVPPQDVSDASDAPKWFQLYADNDEAVTTQRISAAQEAGFEAVVITVDTPMLAVRYEALPDLGAFFDELTRCGVTAPVTTFCDRLDWAEIDRIAASTTMPVILKGVLHPEDAKRAPDHGAAAVIVSNHGGRQMDGAIPPALALPDVVDAADGRLEVYVDGGIRTGVDVLRALALGARAVLVGRPYLWALAVDGQQGVADLLERFRAETQNAMALAGQTDANEIDPSIVVHSDRISR